MLHLTEPEQVALILGRNGQNVDPATVFLSGKAATAVVPYCADTLKKARCEGVLACREGPKFHRFGRFIRYRLDELVAWRDAVVKAQ